MSEKQGERTELRKIISRNEALAHVTAGGRGAAIFRELRGLPLTGEEERKKELEAELNGLVTAFMDGRSRPELLAELANKGVKKSQAAYELVKHAAAKQMLPGESVAAATERLLEETGGYDWLLALERAERESVSPRAEVRKDRALRNWTHPGSATREYESRVEELAKSIRHDDPLLTREQAHVKAADRILEEDADLASRVFAEERGEA